MSVLLTMGNNRHVSDIGDLVHETTDLVSWSVIIPSCRLVSLQVERTSSTVKL